MAHRILTAASLALASLAITTTALALPPGEHGRGFREGANHHLGDDSFVASTGRAPVASTDTEAERMHVHLAYVRAWLGGRPATRPELEDRRHELLSYLDEYIAKGTTPSNAHIPWRNPVFIDDDGTICAVGYLIERASGRPLAESIARAHRYDYLEDIASAVPEVAKWVEGSGFTLEELASIQPGYIEPVAEAYVPWDLSKTPRPDGAFEEKDDDGTTRGRIKDGRMEGEWTRTDAEGRVVGRGTLVHGRGSWRSTYTDGVVLAEGGYARNHPSGIWRFYHPSGRLAAVGSFDAGVRNGAWQFLQDDARGTPIAMGQFDRGTVSGVWHHFDTKGHLLAASRDQTPAQWTDWGKRPAGHLLSIVPGKDGLRHVIHEGNVAGDWHRIDLLAKGGTQVYVLRGEVVYDVDGNKLTKGASGEWSAQDCHWSDVRKHAAHVGDLVTLHGLVFRDYWDESRACGAPHAVGKTRGERIDALIADVRDVRSESPAMLKKLVLGDTTVEEAAAEETSEKDAFPGDILGARTRSPQDLAKVLATNMTWYVEWPHVDGRFVHVFHTLAGYGPDKS